MVFPWGNQENQTYPKDFILLEGESMFHVAKQLSDAQLIKSRVLFVLYLVATRQRKQLHAGQYLFEGPLSLNALVAELSDPRIPLRKEIEVTLIEGWTFVQMSQYFEQVFHDFYRGNFGKEFETLARSNHFQDKYDFLSEKPVAASLEGYLFPDTYRFFQEATPLDVIERLLKNFGSKLDANTRNNILREGRTIHEITTLASILEREVRTLQDKQMVADILYRRLEVGMPLQVDATVNYITGKNDPSVSGIDLEIDSPYNTYRYVGLPPGPISNPGMDSLFAAIYPTPNEYWYFLTTLDDGKVIYSKAFAEHQENQAKYLGYY